MISSEVEQARLAPARRESLLAAAVRWRHLDALVLSLMVVSIMAFNLLWISLDSDRLYVDFSRHLGDSLGYRALFTLSHPLRLLEKYVYYPPFFYWVTDVFYLFFGSAFSVSILSNVVFVAILVFATYGIGKRSWNSRVGVLSALFVSTTPMLVTLFKEYMLDAALTAMVAAALYFLIRSESFRRRGPSLVLGVTCGLGMLTKWTFPFFLALPILVAALIAVQASLARRSFRRIVNMAGAGLIAFAICGVWYVHNYAQLRKDLSFNATEAGALVGNPPVGSLSSLLWYFWNLLNNQLYLIPFLFLAAGVVVTFLKDRSASRNFYPLLTIVGTYLAFTFLRNKDFRHTLPMLPAVAVVATSWLEYLRPQARRVLSAGLAAYCIAAFFVISFGLGFLPKEIKIPIKARSYTSNLFELLPVSPTITGIVVFAQHGFLIGPPSHEKWYHDELFKEMAARSGGHPFSFSYTGADEGWFTTWVLNYYAERYRAAWAGGPQAAQFLIVRGDPPAGLTQGFTEIRDYPLPYGGPARLYQRT